jgi:hypothetical protein
VWADAAKPHADFVRREVSQNVQKLVKKTRDTRVRSTVLAFTRHFLDLILDPSETEFADAISCYEKFFPVGRTREQAKALFLNIFDYDKFRDKDNFGKHWNAYDLCARSRFGVCPYCHLRTTGTALPDLANGVKGYRPDLDHYHPKSEYPFLALSLGNLIPVCELCNGPKMKHDADVLASPMLHPMRHPESIRFALGEAGDFESPLMWNLQGPDSAYRIEVIGHMNIGLSARAITVFQLVKRYNESAVVTGVLDRMRELGREWDQTHKLFAFVAKTDYRTLTASAYRNRLQGRLFRDLHEQLCVPLPMK